MSRVIKFRAWDGDRMTTCGIQFNNTTGEIESKGNESLMQFTGLHDVNGAEVYEGDVMSYDDDEPCFSIALEDGAFRKQYAGWDESLVKPILNSAEIKLMQSAVIGNIYEHPHLLNTDK